MDETTRRAASERRWRERAASACRSKRQRMVLCESDGMSWLDENPNCARTYADVSLSRDALDPDAATRALDLEPSLALAKGQEMPAGRIGTARRQRTGAWSLSTDNVVRLTSRERHLLHLLDAPATAALHALLSAEDIRAEFFCYWLSATGHGGPEVSPETLGRIAALTPRSASTSMSQSTKRLNAGT
jgi:hypothetical protein